MVEQSNTCESHCDAILVASLNNIIVTDATACLCYIFYTALVCTLDDLGTFGNENALVRLTAV